MVSATTVLEDLANRGITATLEDGNRLLLRPRDRVDPEVLSAVRSVRTDVIRQLKLREVGAARDDAETYLCDRLRAGAAWIDATQHALDRKKNTGLVTKTVTTPHGWRTDIKHTRLSAQFVNCWDTWHRLESVLREVLNYKGCVLSNAGPCDPDGVMRCRACCGRDELS